MVFGVVPSKLGLLPVGCDVLMQLSTRGDTGGDDGGDCAMDASDVVGGVNPCSWNEPCTNVNLSLMLATSGLYSCIFSTSCMRSDATCVDVSDCIDTRLCDVRVSERIAERR